MGVWVVPIDNNQYLSHHGILGMKWGQRNGPPYPLSAGSHSAREKKAGWRKSLINKANEKVYNKYARDPGAVPAVPKKQSIKEKVKSKWNSLTPEQQRAIKIGAAALGAALVTYGAYRVVKSRGGSVTGFKIIGIDTNAHDALLAIDFENYRDTVPSFLVSDAEAKKYLDTFDYIQQPGGLGVPKTIQSLKDLDTWSPGENTPDNCLKIINEEFADMVKGKEFFSMPYEEQVELFKKVPPPRASNCIFCTTAYELNRRGYKCRANDRTYGGWFNELDEVFEITDKNAIAEFRFDKQAKSSTSSSKIKEILKGFSENYPEGARGNMIVAWKEGGGHSMAWEIINGQLTVLDGQTGSKYDNEDELITLFERTSGKIRTLRTDNAKLKETADYLLRSIEKSK